MDFPEQDKTEYSKVVETMEAAAEKARPCPLCGVRLVYADDHHGAWLEHPWGDLVCPVRGHDLMSQDDIDKWNAPWWYETK